ncbi:MAG: helix-turn-helix domain-containing protein [Thermoleophilaceae bacterium]
MQAIGERLREARMRQGLDLTEVEVATKIRAKYLRALENDEFSMLPGSTYVKSFLRTYAEYLGLDAQLLVEEFRAQHEPRGEGEIPSFAPPGRARPPRERRGGGGGMAIGPGVLAVAAVLLVLLLLAVIGLVSGGDEGGGGKSARKTTKSARKKANHKHEPAKQAAPATPPSTVKVKIAPTEPTYVCVDDGHKTIFEATITSAHSFRERRVRVNLGRPSAKIFVNGELFRYREGAEAVGFSFSRTGRATRLPLGDRPCA